MELRSLGTSKVQITPIVMGTWQAGKDMWVGIDDSESIEALRAGFEAGITTIDTAEYYGNGHSEGLFQPSQVRPGHTGMPRLFKKPQDGLSGPLPDPLALWLVGNRTCPRRGNHAGPERSETTR